MKKIEPTIYMIDDCEFVRLSLDHLSRSVGFLAKTHISTEDFLAANRPDTETCLALDIRRHITIGLDFQEQLNEAGIHIPIILMTGHGDIPMSVRGMKASAIGFLTKLFLDQDMLDAVALAFKVDQKRRGNNVFLADIESRSLTLREQQVSPWSPMAS